ncbi:hypothetical protein AB9F39_35240, partial [Rhizobium leguminosarum]|uniref:hypothetical protein n=1 Tax=Rhizobium leguminosarum TaxID=384 RepID=UPI003F996807
PELNADDLAAFGYSSLVTVNLWHKTGRHFTFSLDVSLLMDLTSRSRTDPPPHDLEEIYRAAGVDMPENAVEPCFNPDIHTFEATSAFLRSCRMVPV